MEGEKKPKKTRRGRKPNGGTVDEAEDQSKQATAKKAATTRRPTCNYSQEAVQHGKAFVGWAKELGVDGLATHFKQRLVKERPPIAPAPSYEQNADKNRYQDVICLEETRVKLQKEQPQETDYIHANFVRLPDHDRLYICTQAPMDSTIVDFWRMIVQEKAPVVVNLTQCCEDGKSKSVQYWPTTEGEQKNYGRFTVLVKKKDVEDNGRLSIYILEILQEGCSDSHVTRLIHSSAWSDGGVAESAKHVLRVIKTIYLADTVAKGLPIVIHCSAGIGRTGTLVLIDYTLYRIFTLGKQHNLLDSFLQLREQRASSVQKEAQFVHIAVCVSLYIALALKDPTVTIWADELERNFKMKYGKN